MIMDAQSINPTKKYWIPTKIISFLNLSDKRFIITKIIMVTIVSVASCLRPGSCARYSISSCNSSIFLILFFVDASIRCSQDISERLHHPVLSSLKKLLLHDFFNLLANDHNLSACRWFKNNQFKRVCAYLFLPTTFRLLIKPGFAVG